MCQCCENFTYGENFDKKYRAAVKRISNHESIKQQPHLSAAIKKKPK